jgi:hypothetical protein
MRIDRDSARVRSDADGVQTDPVDPWAASGRDEEVVAAELPSILELQNEFLAVAGGGGRVHSEYELDSVTSQRLAKRVAERCRFPREHMLSTLDERHLAAEATHNLCELGTGRPASEHE